MCYFSSIMNLITLPKTLHCLLSIGILSLLNSCGSSYSSATIPSVPTYVGSGSFKTTSSSATKIIVKTGSLNLDTNNVRETGEQIEGIVTGRGGHILNLNERDDKHQSASYSLRIPAQELVNTMDDIAELGKVTYRQITVSDKTKESIAQKARLNKLKQRRKRLQSMYDGAKELSDKLDIEKTLSEVEEEIFSIEEAIRQLGKFAKFSKLSISLSQKTIRGPVGASLDGVSWTWRKLFTIRE